MKRIIGVLFAMFMVLLQIPAFGAETAKESGKDLCVLYSQSCPNQSLTYQEKIARLQEEIGKGTEVYSVAELNRLNDKLKEAEEMFYNLQYGPSGHGHGHGHR